MNLSSEAREECTLSRLAIHSGIILRIIASGHQLTV